MIKKLLKLLTPSERKRAAVLLGMILLMGLLDMVGVASIMPFMAVLGNPEIVETNAIFKRIFVMANNFGIHTTGSFLFVLGIFVFVFLIASLVFKAFTTYMQSRFAQMLEYSISKRLVEGYLNQSYSWFLSRNSADLGKSILSEVGYVVGNGFTPLINLISNATVTIVILFLLIIANSNLAIIIGMSLTTFYLLIYKATNNMLERGGEIRYKANKNRFLAVSEAFGASKEVKIFGLEQAFIDRYSDPARSFARNQAKALVIAQLPRFALEGIAFGGMLLVLLYLMAQSGDLVSALPTIALYAYAGYKLMPALQAMYVAVTNLRHTKSSINALHHDFRSLKPANSHQAKSEISFSQAITLNQIQFYYPNAPQPAIKDLSLKIPAHSLVGIVGTTGSGKTTTVDLILGLLEAQKGTLKVDGQVITEQNRRAWQDLIGYVPQHIYLSDDTVAANIAFGVKAEEIDNSAVERAARIANLHEFVVSELPYQYQTNVGERGVRLSGGQRQRIGIARALYRFPKVLILDEATSALDNLTEQAVMEAVNNLGRNITIILIAHRLSTVKACDTIFFLEKGELIEQGTFNELTQANGRFKSMAANH